MGVSGGPNMIEDGLVLALDASDKNSLPSAPIVNLVLNPTFSGSNDSQNTTVTSNWIFSGDTSPNGFRYYTGSIAGVTPLFSGEGMAATLGPNTGSQNRRVYYTGGSQANTTYTLSFYYYLTGSAQPIDVFIFEYSGSTNVKTTTFALNTGSINTWNRHISTFTTGTGSTGITNWGTVLGATNPVGMFMQRLQVEKSPYANDFVNGTRSIIWNDLISNNSGSLLSSSVSSSIPKFNSPNENVLNFDGTGSFVILNSPWSHLSSSATETIFSVNNFGTSLNTSIGGYDMASATNFSLSVVGMIYLDNTNKKIASSVITTTQTYRTVTSTTTVNTGSYYHVVLNKDTINGTLQLYINGILESTNTFNTGSYAQWPTTGSFIGSNVIRISNTLSINPSFDSKFLNGKLPVFKLYNRILSQSEVLQNYNAIKSRFNL